MREISIELLRRPGNDRGDPQRFVAEMEAEVRPLCRALARLLTA